MAFITLSGTLLDPNGDLAVGDQIRFTHKSTTGETVQSAVSIITVNPAGTYSLPLQYGLVLVEYKDVRTQQFKNLGVATVNQDNPATSIPELLNALVPVSSAELIEFQAILADCVAAQLAAELAASEAAASAASINPDIFITIFDTYSLFQANTTNYPVGKVIKTTEFSTGKAGGASYAIVSSSSLPSIFQGVTASGDVYEILEDVISPLQVGYNLTASEMVDVATVDANWQIIKDYISALESTNRFAPKYRNMTSLSDIYANWISGTRTPVGFYSDSTTDGAKTTGHVASVGTDAPFEVTINESPNAYPKVLQSLVAAAGPTKTDVDIYNGGFDSQSYLNGFGLKQWYNTWFRGLSGSNVNWSDVKMIVIGFGTSDSANIDNTAEVIAAYSIDVECSIIDCLLRGVQPVLQQPVMTVQHFGNTGGAERNGDQTITIINAVQSDLVKKYGLEQLSYSQPFQECLDGFNSVRYGELIDPAANDQVHPVDLGHRVMAGYLLKEFNKQIIRISEKQVNAFAGSPNYIVENEALNITDNVLTRCITEFGASVQMLGEYFYKFPSSAADEILLRLYVYCENPTTLRYLPIDNSVAQPKILINSVITDSNGTIEQEMFEQPVTRLFASSRHTMHLQYGINQIQIRANATGGEQLVGGLQLIPTNLIKGLSLYRQTAGTTVYNNFTHKFRNNNFLSAEAYDIANFSRSYEQYNPADNVFTAIAFTLNQDLASATDYEINSHYNDYEDKADCYNRFVINDDTISIYKVINGVSTLSTTITNAGISPAMVAGNTILIRIRTRFFSSSDTEIQIWSQGAQIVGGTVTISGMWTNGYGLQMNNIICSSVNIQSTEALSGFNQKIT